MNATRTNQSFSLLLVEDNPGDVDLMLEVLNRSPRAPHISVAIDGVDALEQLRAPRELPDLIILDLNLPRKDGRTVLREIKSDPRLQAIPVVVLSSSEADRDLVDAYQLHANCYVTKPADLDQFLGAVKGIEEFWMGVVRLPRIAASRAPGADPSGRP